MTETRVLPTGTDLSVTRDGVLSPRLLATARQTLDAADSLPEVNRIVDQAGALRALARAAHLSQASQNDWAEYKLDAERKGGELLRRMAANRQRVRPGDRGPAGRLAHRGPIAATPSLAELGIDRHRAARWQQLASIPEQDYRAYVAAARERGDEITRSGALSLARERERAGASATRRAARHAVPADLPRVSDRFRLLTGDLLEAGAQIEPESVDALITDPPYGREYLALHGALAELGARILKPGGSLLAMVGHAHLPEVFEGMCPHLTYHWILALTMGAPSAAVWSRATLVGWKPVLWFVKGRYAGAPVPDLIYSDRRDKAHHTWGQSERGFDELVYRFSRPGQVICDPFVGGGTCAVVALQRDRRFIGIDVDPAAIETTAARIRALDPAGAQEAPGGG